MAKPAIIRSEDLNMRTWRDYNPHMRNAFNGNSPLHYASQMVSKEACEEMVKKGHDPLAQNDNGETIMHAFVERRYLPACLWAHSLGLTFPNNVLPTAEWGYVQLPECVGLVEFLDAVMPLGFDINSENKWGHTVLDWAINNERSEKLIEQLRMRGAKLGKKQYEDEDKADKEDEQHEEKTLT